MAVTLATKQDATDRPVASTILINATIITVNAQREIVLEGAILIRKSLIERIGKTQELLENFAEDISQGHILVEDCQGKIVIPGLVNTHAHLAQSLLRGLAENLDLHSWLCDAIWPLEASYGEDDGYVASMLTISEMLLSGTTTFLEAMLTHGSGIHNVVRAVGELGIRACVGKLVKSIESNASLNMTDARDKDCRAMSIDSALHAHHLYDNGFGGRLKIWIACGTPRGSAIEAHENIGKIAETHNIGLTMHCAEAPKDLEIFRKSYTCSPMQFCQRTKIASRRTVLAHMVHPDPAAGDFEIMQASGTTISHNPTSNCKLGSGISPIPAMLKAGVRVALGTDGAPCNNTYDMFREMHLASLIHSGKQQKAHVIDAMTVLEMATINGARALGLDESIGSLEIGKKADIVVVDALQLRTAPWDPEQVKQGGLDPVTVLVHCCTGSDVDMVFVDGRLLVKQKTLIDLDVAELSRKAAKTISSIRSKANLSVSNSMGLSYV